MTIAYFTAPIAYRRMDDTLTIFDGGCSREAAAVWLLPVPFDATTSYRPGTALGPEAIRLASTQLERLDPVFGDAATRVWMEPSNPEIEQLSKETRALAEPIIAQGAEASADGETVATIDAAGERVRKLTRDFCLAAINAGKIPGLVGGEHSVSLGGIEAATSTNPEIGILQIDAHMDLRNSYQGLRHSHASIMHNALTPGSGITKLVQVSIRDISPEEIELATDDPRIATMFDHAIAEQLGTGRPLISLLDEAIEALPEVVYLTIDIDGLDPSLCPRTGTPVPGGLTFNQFTMLVNRLSVSGRRIVGFDLVEVAPDPVADPGTCLDSIMGARALLRACGAAMRSHQMF